MNSFEEGFLKDCIKRLTTYKDLGDRTLEQLSDEDINYVPNEESNSIGVIIKHMHGNMMSRFTNFLTEDGEKPWRKRDAEFEAERFTKAEVMKRWNEGWQCVMHALQALQPADLTKIIYIRQEPLVVYDAILRQLAHYPNHVGQILYIGKMRKGKDWQSPSIAKGKSKDYNEQLAQKFKSQ